MPPALAPNPVATAAREGLSAPQKSLPPWLFYDERGSNLFEQITLLPEYYLTRTERALLERNIDEILLMIVAANTVVELGAGTAAKTGVVLEACTRFQQGVLYQPIDISPTALDEAHDTLTDCIPDLVVRSQIANYITEPYLIEREADRRVLALYIGSSIGNFSPAEARGILAGLRRQLQPGDHLLLGTDLAPSPAKSVQALLAAYDDAAGITAAFNKNILTHLNRELGTDFDLDCFSHEARWNETESRIEMHLRSSAAQTVMLPDVGPVRFLPGETIHTENSYKFTDASIAALLAPTGFSPVHIFHDPDHLYALTLAEVV